MRGLLSNLCQTEKARTDKHLSSRSNDLRDFLYLDVLSKETEMVLDATGRLSDGLASSSPLEPSGLFQ